MKGKIVLALGGGGARGLAHIGVLKALNERRIRIKAITGTSMGTVVGAMYCSGKSPEEIQTLLETYVRKRRPGVLGVSRLMHRRARTPLGVLARNFRQRLLVNIGVSRISLFSLKSLVRLIDAVIPDVRIQDLPLPFAAVSTDLLTGRDVVLDAGDLRTAVLASINIAGFFPPVPWDGKLLVDAGITQMVPVLSAAERFGRPVWAVDVSQALEPMTGKENLVDLTYRYASITQCALRDLHLAQADRILVPEVGDLEWFAFQRLEEAVESGYQAAMADLEG